MFVILEKMHKLFSMKTHHLRSLKIQAFNNNFNKNATSIFFKVVEKKHPITRQKIITKIYDFVVVQWPWTKSTKKKRNLRMEKKKGT